MVVFVGIVTIVVISIYLFSMILLIPYFTLMSVDKHEIFSSLVSDMNNLYYFCASHLC
jgi:hypothetical protein